MPRSFRILAAALTCGVLLAFAAFEGELVFAHPDNKNSSIAMTTDVFHDFSKEYRDKDYYYSGEGKDGFICSVLFYQLNKREQKEQDAIRKAADVPVPETSPVLAMVHFSMTSPTKELERNEATWGQPEDDFVFRQVDIPEFQGKELPQKNMFAYTMIGKDMFVDVHLSKVLCTPADSLVMRNILGTLRKGK
jgi:hypothetical protein